MNIRRLKGLFSSEVPLQSRHAWAAFCFAKKSKGVAPYVSIFPSSPTSQLSIRSLLGSRLSQGKVDRPACATLLVAL